MKRYAVKSHFSGLTNLSPQRDEMGAKQLLCDLMDNFRYTMQLQVVDTESSFIALTANGGILFSAEIVELN